MYDDFEPQIESDTIKKTSKLAFEDIKDSGLLSKRRLEVLSILFEHGPQTAMEVSLKITRLKSPSTGSNVHPRLSELGDRGCAKKVGEKKCHLTGQLVTIWEATGELPTEPHQRTKTKCKACNGAGYFYADENSAEIVD